MQKQLASRALVLVLILAMGWTVMSLRLFDLQVLRHDDSEPVPREARLARVVIPAPRGQIFDRNGERLTRNELGYRLVVDRNWLSSEAVALQGLQKTRGLSRGELLREYDPTTGEMGRHYLRDLSKIFAAGLYQDADKIAAELIEGKRVEVVLDKRVPAEKAFELMEELDAAGAVGVRWEPRWLRSYPQQTVAGHLLGYVNYNGAEGAMQACEGLEFALDELLSGKEGVRKVEIGRLGQKLAAQELLEAPKAGKSVRLSLDLELQKIAEEELAAGIAEFRAERGAAVMLNPKTGEVLAMASWPVFDPNSRRGERANHAVSMRYEPGSTIKAIAVAGGLDQGLIRLTTPIDCGWETYREAETKVSVSDHHYYGVMSVLKIVQKSSNIGTYKIARQLGLNAWFRYAHAFGFGEQTGVSLTGEARGTMVNTNNAWDFSRQSFGYAANVTPIQLASAYAAIANEGERIPPRLVQAILDEDGNELGEMKPSESVRVISPRAARDLTKALAAVTEEGGTATRAAIEGYSVAGKTGTAQRYQEEVRDIEGKIIKRGGYRPNEYVVSFVGFAPAENPEFVCAVVIDNPRPRNVKPYGGTIAAPIFRAIGERSLSYLEVEPTREVEAVEVATAQSSRPTIQP